jgi:hypothetical protein
MKKNTKKEPLKAAAKKLLPKVTVELVEAKDIIKEEKKKLKKVKDPLEKKNRKRALDIIKKAAVGLKDHREILKAEISSPIKGDLGSDERTRNT